VCARGSCSAALDPPNELRSTGVRPAWSSGPSTSPLDVADMLRAALRLLAFALLTAVVYAICSALLGYLTIDVLDLHAPSPKSNEMAIHTVALGYFIPGVFFLSALGLLMAWGAATAASSKTLAALAIVSGLVVATLESLEDLPRSHALWLGFLLPVVVVVVTFVPLKILAARQRRSAATSNNRWRGP
jgi:hypothetical protein